jgi:hypothetical protein
MIWSIRKLTGRYRVCYAERYRYLVWSTSKVISLSALCSALLRIYGAFVKQLMIQEEMAYAERAARALAGSIIKLTSNSRSHSVLEP